MTSATLRRLIRENSDYAGLGKKQETFKWPEEACYARHLRLYCLKIDPCLVPLRSDPRLDDLVRRVGLSK